MSESFRRQIAAVGLEDARTLLTSVTTDLKALTRALDAAVKPLTERYGNLAGIVESRALQIERESNRLLNAADKLKSKNEQMLAQVQSLSWHAYAAVAIVIFGLGLWTGINWEHRNVSDAIADLQNDTNGQDRSTTATDYSRRRQGKESPESGSMCHLLAGASAPFGLYGFSDYDQRVSKRCMRLNRLPAGQTRLQQRYSKRTLKNVACRPEYPNE